MIVTVKHLRAFVLCIVATLSVSSVAHVRGRLIFFVDGDPYIVKLYYKGDLFRGFPKDIPQEKRARISRFLGSEEVLTREELNQLTDISVLRNLDMVRRWHYRVVNHEMGYADFVEDEKARAKMDRTFNSCTHIMVIEKPKLGKNFSFDIQSVGKAGAAVDFESEKAGLLRTMVNVDAAGGGQALAVVGIEVLNEARQRFVVEEEYGVRVPRNKPRLITEMTTPSNFWLPDARLGIFQWQRDLLESQGKLTSEWGAEPVVKEYVGDSVYFHRLLHNDQIESRRLSSLVSYFMQRFGFYTHSRWVLPGQTIEIEGVKITGPAIVRPDIFLMDTKDEQRINSSGKVKIRPVRRRLAKSIGFKEYEPIKQDASKPDIAPLWHFLKAHLFPVDGQEGFSPERIARPFFRTHKLQMGPFMIDRAHVYVASIKGERVYVDPVRAAPSAPPVFMNCPEVLAQKTLLAQQLTPIPAMYLSNSP